MIIMKFGGAAVLNGTQINNIAKIVSAYHKKEKIVIVVSAMGGVTDKLFEIGELLKKNKLNQVLKILDEIKKQHHGAVRFVALSKRQVLLKVELIKLLSHLKNYIQNISTKEITPARTDFLVSFGERLSVRLLSEALIKASINAYPVDASNLIATTHVFTNAVPLPRVRQKYLDEILLPLIKGNVIPVVTGYIGYSGDGCTTTLGRGGSDLTATYLADFLGAKKVYLWKDVEGFFSDDPKKNPEAHMLKTLSYNEAQKRAKKGAKVIYYKALDPVKKKKIPIYIRSFLNPQHEGTTIN